MILEHSIHNIKLKVVKYTSMLGKFAMFTLWVT